MNRLNSATVFFFSLAIAIGILGYGTLHFLSGINQHSILMQNGTMPVRKVLNYYKYDLNVKGLVFSLSFLVAGLALFTMIALPDKRRVGQKVPPQPVRLEPQASKIAAVAEEEASRIYPESAIVAEKPAAEALKPKPVMEKARIEAEAQMDERDIDLNTLVDLSDEEGSVVYGSGPIANEAIVDFVNNYPDSAIKFLYRKKLDGKGLGSTETKIYRSWEERGMTQQKVKQYILSLMDWEKLPDEYIHQVWVQLRDRIFDLRLR